MFYVIPMQEPACSVRSELGPFFFSEASTILLQITQRHTKKGYINMYTLSYCRYTALVSFFCQSCLNREGFLLSGSPAIRNKVSVCDNFIITVTNVRSEATSYSYR